jgi:hypothetical protein
MNHRLRLLNSFYPIKVYADDAGVAGKFDDIRLRFCNLQEIGSDYGYFPESTKNFIIVPEHNLERAKIALDGLGFTITTGSRYLGGFIGEEAEFETWIEGEARSWGEAIGELALAAKHFPKTAYSGLHKSLQQEWLFLQRVRKDSEEKFSEGEKVISRVFIPALFEDEFDN